MPNVTRTKKRPTKKKGDPSDRIINIGDLERDFLRMCIYGLSSSGKTRLAGTFYPLGKMLYLVCSSNKLGEVKSIRGVEKNKGADVEIAEIQNPDDIHFFGEYAVDNGFKTVVLDHLTGFCDLVLADILKIKKLPEQKSWGMAKRDHYATQGLRVKTYLRDLFDQDLHVIITAQEREFTKDEDEDIIMPYVSVGASPSIAGWVCPAVDYMCHTYKAKETKVQTKKVGKREVTKTVTTDKIKHYLKVGPDPVYITKFRVPYGVELPDSIVDPSYESMKHLLV